MFGILVLEQDPLSWADMPSAIQLWIQAAGGFACIGLVVWVLFYVLERLVAGEKIEYSKVLIALIPLLAYSPYLAVDIGESVSGNVIRDARLQNFIRTTLLTIGGTIAILVVLVPVAKNIPCLRFRRIWALAKLSFKEAVRFKVLWGFSIALVVILFASWFLPHERPQDQVRNYVKVVFWPMTIMLLLTAGLLSSLSLPADIKNQTIHTIVTKPVERFEIVLGRVLGYSMLMSVVLVVMTLISWVYVARGVDKQAEQESLKARVPIYGNWDVKGGLSVGREWEYRKYITGGAKDQWAEWIFPTLPVNLYNRMDDSIPCEFSFDIFRTTRGTENRGVFCTFKFENWQWNPTNLNKYNEELESRLREGKDPEMKVYNDLAEKYGYFELAAKEVSDYHTLAIAVPKGLFKTLPEWSSQKGDIKPALTIKVNCLDRTQYLGVHKYDLYLLNRDGGEFTYFVKSLFGLDEESSLGRNIAFGENFFKAAITLWCRIVLVVVVGVTLSTYLSGVIAFICTAFLYIVGYFKEFIEQIATGKSEGGGPMEAVMRLSKGVNLIVPMEDTPGYSFAKVGDVTFQIILKRFLNLIPDVHRFDWTSNVAEGFDISLGQILLLNNFVPLLGYILPWIILSFFLIRSREVAA